jgi:uncharacterized membrane protein YphA (DoxX/SURF4 family)
VSFVFQNPTVIIFIRLILGGIFIYASLDKIGDPQSFSRSIDHYHLIPFGFENSIAIVLPWLELFIGIGLIFGCMIDGATLLSMILLVVFILAISSAMLRGFNIECGCGLKEGELVGTNKLLENSILFILGLILLNRTSNPFEIFPKSN